MMYDQKIPKSMTIEMQVDNVHDKIFKTVLSNAEEMSKLLKKYIGLEEILEKIGGESEMDEWMDRVLRNEAKEKKKLLAKGIQEGQIKGKISNMIETVKKMLKNQETDEKIILYTDVSEKN